MRGYVQKWHLRYKTSDIWSLKRSGLEPKLLQSVYRNSCTAYRLVTNLETYSKLWPNFPAANFFHNGYLAHFLSERDEIGQRWRSGQSQLIPRISSGGPVIPRLTLNGVMTLFMVALWNRETIYIFILFLLLSSFFLFFPRLISAVGNWMFTILWHMVWP